MKRFSFILGMMILIGSSACNETTRITRPTTKVLFISQNFQAPASQALLESLSQSGLSVPWDSTQHLHFLDEDSLQAYSALILSDIPIDSFHARRKADIRRYTESGGGLLWGNIEKPAPYAWAWLEHLFMPQEKEAVVQKAADQEDPFFQALPSRETHPIFALQASAHQATPQRQTSFDQVLTRLIGTNSYDPSLRSSPRAPEANRFTREVLDSVMIEPMEMAILPDQRVIYIERRGKMKLYDPHTERTTLMHEFDVCVSGNYEDGLLGLALDPNFSENHFFYLYYSPGSDCQRAQTLSRFTMYQGDSLILASEKVILEVPVQRQTCCHSGGSITFGPDGNLWLSTGDNTSSKESDGYSPLDDRPGRGPYDAQKSSGNTHDLRGKILRIRPNKFGRYDIPDGNLFPKDGSQGAPEIYVMGARNPFRIAVDHATGFVYWGDVGPDVGVAGKYGPESYDEFNQARSPGNYGWPYFVGDNYAYRSRDFATDQVGDFYNPQAPRNLSPNNKGSKVLPPARPAYMWYPKGTSENFPFLGQGSNSAMAGPIYHQEQYQLNGQSSFPAYFEDKWFIYEWARSWIQVVTFKPNGDLAQAEPFLPDMPLSKPIDMEFGPDGSLYVLEYGANYFADNPDARLVKITYSAENRAPQARVEASVIAGKAPLKVDFSAAESFDYDPKDSLYFSWHFTDTAAVQAEGPQASFTFEEPGVYPVWVKVRDQEGATTTAPINIQVGNAPPSVEIALAGNRSFFGGPISQSYQVSIADPEDQTAGGIKGSQANVRFVYLDDPAYLHQMTPEELLSQGSLSYLKGKNLMEASDCASCHDMKIKSVGPSYMAIAERYKGQYDMVGYLAGKIITGGNGNWGEKIMAGHPQHSLEETAEMTRYILSLAEKTDRSMPLSSQIRFNRHASKEGTYLLSAAYEDRGQNEIPALKTRTNIIFRAPRVEAIQFDEAKGAARQVTGPNRDIDVVKGMRDGSWLMYQSIDLSGINRIRFRMAASQAGQLVIRQGSPDGEEIGRLRLRPIDPNADWIEVNVPITPTPGEKDLYFYLEADPERPKAVLGIQWWEVLFAAS
ncbi:MAG: PQQ-dependent sugar dehydrogenase [Bacteroidota bacterium]